MYQDAETISPLDGDYPESVRAALKRAQHLPIVQDDDAIVLYGSYARKEQRSDSDVDLLVVGSAKLGCDVYHWPEVVADVSIESQRSLRQKLDRTDEWNNNFWLNALVHGVVLSDTANLLGLLMDEARAKWIAGPPPMFAEQAREAIRAIRTMLRSAKAHKYSYLSLSRERQKLRDMRLDQVVNRAFYLCFKAKRKWTASFPLIVSAARREDPPLYELWIEYLDIAPENAYEVVEKIVELSVEYLTDCIASNAKGKTRRKVA